MVYDPNNNRVYIWPPIILGKFVRRSRNSALKDTTGVIQTEAPTVEPNSLYTIQPTRLRPLMHPCSDGRFVPLDQP